MLQNSRARKKCERCEKFESENFKRVKFRCSSFTVFTNLLREVDVIYQTRDTVFHHISNTEKRVENATLSGVFLKNFEVFYIAMNHSDECLI